MRKLIVLLLALMCSCGYAQTKPHVSQINGDWPTSRISGKSEFDIRDYASESDPFAAVVADALAAGSTSVVLIDEAAYTTDATIIVTSGLIIRGLGQPHPNRCSITFTGCNGFETTPPGFPLTLENIYLIGQKAGGTIATSTSKLVGNVGLYTVAPSTLAAGGLFVRNCVISGWDVGVGMWGPQYYSRFDSVSIIRNSFGILVHMNSTGVPYSANANFFNNCNITSNPKAGIWWGGGVGNVFRDCSIEMNGKQGVVGGLVNAYPEFGITVTGTSTVLIDGGYTENQVALVYGKSASLTVKNMFETSNTWVGVDGQLNYEGNPYTPHATKLDMGKLASFTPVGITASEATYDASVGYIASLTTNVGGGSSSILTSLYSRHISEIGEPIAKRLGVLVSQKIKSSSNSATFSAYPSVYFSAISGNNDASSYAGYIVPQLLNDSLWHQIQFVVFPRIGDPYITDRINRIKINTYLKNATEDLTLTPRTVQMQEPVVTVFSNQPLHFNAP